MKTKILLLVAVAMFTINTTASFGQAPKTDRQTVQNPASNNNQHEPRHKKKRSLFPLLNQEHSKSFRAPQATALLLDSAVTQINPAVLEEGDSEKEKTVFTYNAAGNEILHVTYEWDATAQAWKEIDRRGYDDQGRTILSSYSYTSNSEKWGNKHEYAYDHLNWQTQEIRYSLVNGEWVASYKTVYEYTDQADSYTESQLEYYLVNGDWQIGSKREITYLGERQLRIIDRNSDGGYLPANPDADFPSLPTGPVISNGILAEAFYQYDNDNLVYGHKIEYTINEKGNVTLSKNYDWDPETNSLRESWKQRTDYTYNDAGLITSIVYFRWNEYEENPDWVYDDSYTFDYTYDGNNNVTSYTERSAAGMNFEKGEYTYDAQNRTVTVTLYYGEMEKESYTYKWIKNVFYERAFGSKGNLTLYAYSNWNYDGVLTHQTRQEYDDNGRETLYLYRSESYGYKYEQAYDANGNNILYIEYTYDSDAQTFTPDYKGEYTYGDRKVTGIFSDGETYIPLTYKRSDWDSASSAWVVNMEGKYEWQFDTADNPTTMTMDVKKDGAWVWYGTITFYYSPHTVSGIADVPATVAPRVWISNGAVHVENGDANAIQLFDISGRPVANGHLSPGVYLVRVNGKTVKVVTSNK